MTFAFFGAGDASYFECASLVVIFADAVSAADKKAIEKGIPAPLEVERWTKRTLHVATDNHALVGTHSFTAFNAAIESWLHACHAIAPIDFALRAEDSEASTTFSQWHDDSIASALPLVLDFTARYDDARTRAWAKATLVEMIEAAGIPLPAELDSTPAWRRALDTGDARAFAPALTLYAEELQLALDPENANHRRAVLGTRPDLRNESRIDQHILTIAIYDASADGQHAIDQLLARATRSAAFTTLCATTACQCIEDVEHCAPTAFAVLDRLVELDAHPIVLETALFAIEHIGANNVDAARIDRYCTLALAKLAEWEKLRPYLERLGQPKRR